jgi:GNAT superfamily N-acetyltransferase
MFTMAKPNIVPLTRDHIASAGAVLERRHAWHRRRQSHLAIVTDFASLIDVDFDVALGVAALEGSKVTGYLVGRPATNAFAPAIWSSANDQAMDDPSITSDLYQGSADMWVKQGLRKHLVFVPAEDECYLPWFHLGFGASAYQAAMSLADFRDVPEASGIHVRLSDPRDLLVSARLERQLYLDLMLSPSFASVGVDDEATYIEEWKHAWDNELFTYFVAEVGGLVVGQLFLYRRPTGDLRIPERNIDLASVTTDPAYRGRGVGRALTVASMMWARDAGYTSMTTDWRATNLFSARYWPRFGFKPTFMRLQRTLD